MKVASDEPEPSWLEPGLELNNFQLGSAQLGSWPFPFSSEISLLRLENQPNRLSFNFIEL